MHRLTLFSLCVILMLMRSTTYGQSIWLSRPEKGSIDIEFLRPNFKNENATKLTNSSMFITGRFVSSRITVVAELPVARGDVAGGGSETAVGNPYVGLEFYNPDGPWMFEVGGRIPVMSEDKTAAQVVGMHADFDRFEAFLSDVVTLTSKLGYFRKNDANMLLRLRAGPTFFAETKGDKETDWFLDYLGQVGYDGPQLYLLAGVSGRYFLSAETGSFEERSVHQAVGSLGFKFGSVQPGVHVKLPLDEDLKESLDAVIGVNVGFVLK